MYIDFHVHAFADSIAEKTIQKLEDTILNSDFPIPIHPLTKGTVKELLLKLDEWKIDAGVLLPIATKPSQQTVINNWAAENQRENCPKLYCYGTVHPDAEDALTELERIKAMGLKGIKLHPDYQNFYADEERLFPIYRKCAELNLPVILHAGVDALSMDDIHCTPIMGANILDNIKGITLIMAHLGGNLLWDDVEKYLVGRDVYLDTAFVANLAQDEQVYRIIKKHGANRILLASDCPWDSTIEAVKMIKRLGLLESENELIFYKNALKILSVT